MNKTRLTRSFRPSAALGVLLALLFAYWGAFKPSRGEQLPSREPDVFGRVVSTEVNDGRTRFLVQHPKGGRWFAVVQPNTRIQTRDGESATIAPGQTVSIWQTGMVFDSPPQVYAQWVIIESDEPQGQP